MLFFLTPCHVCYVFMHYVLKTSFLLHSVKAPFYCLQQTVSNRLEVQWRVVHELCGICVCEIFKSNLSFGI